MADQLVPATTLVSAAQRDIVLWTTRDGREIPLDEMEDDHIANAIRVLSVWRARLRKRDPQHAMVRQLAEAITRFKGVQRQRLKRGATSPTGARTLPRPQLRSQSSFATTRARKPVANT